MFGCVNSAQRLTHQEGEAPIDKIVGNINSSDGAPGPT
jgi:hypothetical protein